MPKKHHRQFPKPPSTSPSCFPAGPTTTNSTASSTVNSLLTHLRLSQPPDPSSSSRTPPTRSVPPSLQQILTNAEPPPPPPARLRVGAPRRTRVPGPPPPTSWLVTRPPPNTTAAAADENGKFKAENRDHDLYQLPGLPYIAPHRLMHYTLLAIARDWRFHVVYDQHYLHTLRAGMKSLLLAYVAKFGTDGVDVYFLRVLFGIKEQQEEEEEEREDKDNGMEGYGDISSTEDLKHLDLSNCLGRSLSFQDLTSLFQPYSSTKKIPLIAAAAAPPPPPIQDSWEEPTLLAPPTTRLPSLTHLSLSYPSPTSSGNWKHLQTFTKYIPTITHLSLAGWGLSSSSPLQDPSVTLRKFSRATICLKWLDVADCPVGVYEALKDVEWNKCWRGVETVVCTGGREEVVGGLREVIRRVRKEGGGRWCEVLG